MIICSMAGSRFSSFNLPYPFSAEIQWDDAEHTKTAIDQNVEIRNFPDRAGDKSQGNDGHASQHRPFDHPAVFYRMAVWSDEGHGDHQVCKCQPIVTIGQHGELGVGRGNGGITGIQPGFEAIGYPMGMLQQPMQFRFYRKGGDAAQGESNHEEHEHHP